MPYDQFGYGSSVYQEDPNTGEQYNPDIYSRGETQPSPYTPASSLGFYPANTGNTRADALYGPYLSPAQKMQAEKLIANAGNPQAARGAIDALSMFDRTVEDQARKLGTNLPGVPDWLKAKFPSDPPMPDLRSFEEAKWDREMGNVPRIDPSRSSRSPLNPLIEGPGIKVMPYVSDLSAPAINDRAPMQPRQPRQAGAAIDAPKYTAAQAMPPSQQIAAMQAETGKQIAAARMGVPPERMTYPIDLSGKEKVLPELAIIPTSNMKPDELQKAAAGYQKVLAENNAPNMRARAERYLAMADKLFPGSQKAQIAEQRRIDALTVKADADLNRMLYTGTGANIAPRLSAAETTDTEGKRKPSEVETALTNWKKTWASRGIPEEHLQQRIDEIKEAYYAQTGRYYAAQGKKALEKTAKEERVEEKDRIAKEKFRVETVAKFSDDIDVLRETMRLNSTGASVAAKNNAQRVLNQKAEQYAGKAFDPKDIFPGYTGTRTAEQPATSPAAQSAAGTFDAKAHAGKYMSAKPPYTEAEIREDMTSHGDETHIDEVLKYVK